RDRERLRGDPLLNAPFAESLAEVPDLGLLAVSWAQRAGLLMDHDGELRAGDIQQSWSKGLYLTLSHLWQALLDVEAWDPASGWRSGEGVRNSFPSVYLLTLLLLAKQAKGSWVRQRDVVQWINERHPHWQNATPTERSSWGSAAISGLLFQLCLVQCGPGPHGELLVRLSPLGRWLLS